MSWSVSAVGKPAAVKASLAKQFESAKQSTKSVPHEQESVGSIESVVNGQLDFMAARKEPSAVQVSASGSAWSDANGAGSTQVEMKVMPLHGFVE